MRMDSFLAGATGEGFSGTTLVAGRGEIGLHKSYGFAVKEEQIPVTPNTLFDVGSVTKLFTALVILRLEEEGKLSIGDPISRYFDDVPDDKASITIHHLLTHTAGLHLYSGEDDELISRDEMVRRVLDTELQWPPGTRYRYSNPSFALLGAIIELVTLVPYEQYVRETLFLPSGMLSTGYVLPEFDRALVAHGYAEGEDKGSPLDLGWLPDGPGWNVRANGGMLSTASDIYRLHVALRSGHVLSEGRLGKLLRPYAEAIGTPPRNSGSQSGYGLYVLPTPWGTRRISRSGTSWYGHSDYWHYVEEEIVLVLTTNTQHATAWHVDDTLLGVIHPHLAS
jgi:CubicO group peptidase (beta-lactamase class C family)